MKYLFLACMFVSSSAFAGHMVVAGNNNCKCVDGAGNPQCSRVGEVFDASWNKQCSSLYNSNRSGSVNVFAPKK